VPAFADVLEDIWALLAPSCVRLNAAK